MKEHADYEVFCAEEAHVHYGDPFTKRDFIYYWLRGASGGGSPVMAFKKSAVQPQPAVVSGTNRLPCPLRRICI